MLDGLAVVLQSTKYPENIGSVARACANMGCSEVILVAPQRWDVEKASPLATPKGVEIMRNMRVVDDLESALADFTTVFGTTARTGGWRKAIMTPRNAAPLICEAMAERTPDGKGGAAVVFGPEDRGLTNAEIEICGQLLTIPTMSEAWSLNLSQAVMVVLYECFTQMKTKPLGDHVMRESRLPTHSDQEALYEMLRTTLRRIDFLKADNDDYWMLPVRRFMQRIKLKRNEFNLLMGICRQVGWMAGRADKAEAELERLRAELEGEPVTRDEKG